MQIIDTHQHLLYPDKFKYHWTAGLPALQGGFSLEDYWKLAEGTEIAGTIFMEVNVPPEKEGVEARLFCSMAENPANKLLGVIAAGRPEEAGFAAHIDSIAHPKLKGIRRVLHIAANSVVENPLFARNVAILGPKGLTFDLCVRADQLPLVTTLASQCPGTQFILDHCGGPDVKSHASHPWREHIGKIARLPNVAAKISGIIANADPNNWKPADLQPFIDHVLECFGWDRVVFGTDWPVCNLTANLNAWVDLALKFTETASPSDREKLFSLNAKRIYRL